jgi:asparagine synthase (glutamine-hydrolysing)
MCGICGQYRFASGEPVDERVLGRMTDAMTHRGPDDRGLYVSGSLGLGFRRLSIIDLAGGHQPMTDPDRQVWVVFNGEITNFPELRRELEGAGYRFRTSSDTEVIVHGYRRWGPDVLDRLNGMFGVAIWDEERKRLVVARDPAGIKLIYYRLDARGVHFASEVRALLAADPAAKARPDPTALNLFLRYRYTPSPLTMFEGIRKLAPGTRLVVEDGKARVERWWNFSPEPFDPAPPVAEAEEAVHELYRAAVKRNLLSDVPLGLLLSGGLDSGLLLALMNREGDSWRTFTVGYGESFAGDELEEAGRTAEVLGSEHASVRLSQTDFEQALSGIVRVLEEPIASSSVVPMYQVCQRARQDVKVALIGQGPDELFGGYKRHVGVRYGSWWRRLPKAARAPLKAALFALPRNESVKRALYSLDVPDRLRRYQQVFSLMDGPEVDGLFREGLLPEGAGDRILECWSECTHLMNGVGELGGLQFLEIRSTLPDELLMYGDKLSMAHSLEVRVPYLDREVIEYVERLPDSYKVRLGRTKWLHRRICRKHLPPEVLARKKRGFAANVVDDWFRASLAGRLERDLSDADSPIYEYLEREPVQRLLREHRSGRHDHHKILFSLVVFGQWLEVYA